MQNKLLEIGSRGEPKVAQGLTLPQRSIDTTGAINIDDCSIVVDTTSSPITVTLPTAVDGKIYIIKCNGTNILTIATTNNQLIDGLSTLILGKGQSKWIQSNSVGWFTISNEEAFNTIKLNTNPLITGFIEGQFYYDNAWKTISVDVDSDVTLQVGQEELVRVYNTTGAVIHNGEIVYITGVYSGGSNNVPTVAKAQSNAYATSGVFGVATQEIAASSYGFITVRGNINDLNTDALGNDGDELWLSSTTPGAFTTTIPSAPNLQIKVGTLITKSSTAGRINVRIQPAFRLTDLSDVNITTPREGDIVTYNAVTNSWVNVVNALPTYSTVAALRLATGVENLQAVCVETSTVYRYETSGSAYTDDGKYVTITGDHGDTRWVGTAGVYVYDQMDAKFICNKLIAGTDATTYTVDAPLVLDDTYGSLIELNVTGSNQTVTLPATSDSQQGEWLSIGIVNTSPHNAILQTTNTNLDHEYVLTPGTMVSFEFGRSKWHLMGGKNAITQLDQLGQPSYKTTQDWMNAVQSSGVISGGACTDDGAGGVDITGVVGIIKVSDSDMGGSRFFSMAGKNFPAMNYPNGLEDGTNFLYIDYASGTPIFQATSDRFALDRTTQIVIANIFKDGDDLEVINLESGITNFSRKVVNRLIEVNGVSRLSGANISESGTRGIQTDNGVFYYGLERLTTSGKDTGGGDFYETYVRDGFGGWNKIKFEQTVDSLKYDNNLAPNALGGIEDATNAGGLINIKITGHGLATDDLVHVQDCLGTTEANGNWRITKIGNDNFTLNGSVFVHTYGAGSGQALHLNLATVTNDADHYGVHWVFICTKGDIYVVYGQDNYAHLVDAQTAALPATLPEYIYFNTVFAAKIITHPATANFTQIISGYTNPTAITTPTTHNALGGLNVGDYKHLTAVEYAGLSGIGSITSGTYSRLAMYHSTPTGNALADSVPDNDASHVVGVVVAPHVLTGGNRVYTIPSVGADASVVMTEGTQTINGAKTFGSAIAGSITGNAGTVTGFSPASGKVLSLSNTLTLAGTDSSTLNIGSGGTLGTAAYTAAASYQAAAANLTSLSSLSYGALSFIKMSAAGTFSLDTTSYLTSLAGAVLTDQTAGQTIGSTGSRLAKLWATDITCSNNIAGSITGNAGTVTGFSPTNGKILSLSNTLTLAGTDSSTLNIGSGGTLGTAAYIAANTKQDTLVSASNIKSINGVSILASGDLTLLTSLSGSLLATGATTGATSQKQGFTKGVSIAGVGGATTGSGPLVIISTPLLTTPEAGNHEYNGDHYATMANNVRVAHTGILYTDVADHSNSGGGGVGTETTLATYTMPANTLDTNGEYVEVGATISVVGAGNSIINLYFGSTVIYTIPSGNYSGQSIQLRAKIFRTGATTQRATATALASGNAVSSNHTYTTPAETLSGVVVIKITGANGTINRITQRTFDVRHFGASA